MCQHAKSCGTPHTEARTHIYMSGMRAQWRGLWSDRADDLQLLLAPPPEPATASYASYLSAVPLLVLPLSLCFLLLYGAAPSSSNPQEVIDFLIICTSNRGRHGDADHKFSLPPPSPSPPLWCDSAATAASNWGCRFKLLTYDFPPIH